MSEEGSPRARRGKIYTTRAEKLRDFLIGFVAWFVINGLLWAAIAKQPDRRGQDVLDSYPGLFGNLCLLPLNILVLIVLAVKRRWVSLGLLAALALNLFIALILGLTMYGTCGVPFFADYFRG